jgi:hypothetical protein
MFNRYKPVYELNWKKVHFACENNCKVCLNEDETSLLVFRFQRKCLHILTVWTLVLLG